MKKSNDFQPYLPLLMDLLVRTDALWQPFRFTNFALDHKVFAAITQRQRQFRSLGLPLNYGGAEAARQSMSRQCGVLKNLGLIELRGKTRGRCARLTPKGELLMRWITPAYTIWEAWPLLVHVELARLGNDGTNAGYTLEDDIHPLAEPDKERPQALTRMANRAVPLIVAGLLDVYTDTVGHLGYKVTEAGQKALQGDPPPEPDDLPNWKEFDLADDYFSGVDAGLDERAIWIPEDNSECVIPLGAGSWPLPAPVEGRTDA